ncbi:MAG: hypothetical protein MJZ49_05715 [Bacteroidales bacterium]|nr:hypothetical protein [Bacteroidales bacterium]
MSLILPKHNADPETLKMTLGLFYNKNNWIDNATLIKDLSNLLISAGIQTSVAEPQSYTKKCQILCYYGFLKWQNTNDSRSPKMITPMGQTFYQALIGGDEKVMVDCLMTQIISRDFSFGRNNCGCESDSDIEAPNVFIKSSLILDGLSFAEFASILGKLESGNSFENAISYVKICRFQKIPVTIPQGADKFKDAKPITALCNWGLLTNDKGLLSIKDIYITQYYKNIEKLHIFNTDVFKFLGESNEIVSDLPLQQIFYGAPGTGKSYKVNELTKGDDTVIRTTFHPDSDYASFVGCYKPIEKEETRTFVHWDTGNQEPVLLKVSNKTGIPELDKEKKITYQFTQQAFLKAYIQAWKKLCKNNHSAAASSITTVVPPVGSVSLSFPVKSITYTIIEVTTNSIRVKREFDLIKNSVKNVWESLWTSGDFIIPRGSQSGRSVQIAVCRWIYENLDDSTKDSFDDGWTLLIDTLNSGEVYVSVADSKSSQVYTVTKIEDNDASVHISNVASSKRARLKKCFEGTKPDGVEIGLIDVLKRIDPESFDGAWETLTGKITKGENEYLDIQDVELIENKEDDGLITDPQYLVIEEINRGNCAQIFGDIFQLLDRNEAGFSTYPIVPDADITRELKKVFENLDLSSVKNYINGIFSENYPGRIVDKIKSGELLVLPCNLKLLATMNTSDQSLFPMDSAFKRRWDWEYVPIRYEKTKEENEKNDPKDNFDTFTITIDDKHHYLWTDFLQNINKKILSVTDSEDKQMGEYFIKKSVDQKTFINKVMYYLWSEVGKDNFNSTNNALFVLPDGLIKETKDGKEEDKKEFSFNELFKGDATKLLQGFMKKLEVKSEEEKAAEKAATPAGA